MALTEDEIVRVRRFVGDDPPDDDLNAIYLRHETLKGTVLEILEIRRSNLLASPLSFSVVGEYGQNARYNVEFIQKMIDDIRSGRLDPDNDDLEADTSVVSVTAPDPVRR